MKTTEQMLTDAIKRNQELDKEIKEVNNKIIDITLNVAKMVSDNEKKDHEIKELNKQLEFYTKLNEK